MNQTLISASADPAAGLQNYILRTGKGDVRPDHTLNICRLTVGVRSYYLSELQPYYLLVISVLNVEQALRGSYEKELTIKSRKQK